jgi:uncharacterized protein (TIGR02145 family)
MKKIILLLIVLFITQSAFSQKIILHRNVGGDQIYQLSSVDSITFLPFACGDEIRYEGQTYHTVLIGTQCWMKENLNVGTMIQSSSNQLNNSIIEKYCYNNDTANCSLYGGYYQWDEAMQYITSVGAQGLCPVGWHIPALNELQALATSVNGNGNELKREDQGTGGGVGINTSGFSALLVGYRYVDAAFNAFNDNAFFYSSTQENSTEAWYLYLTSDNTTIGYFPNNRLYGMTIRCLKDQ